MENKKLKNEIKNFDITTVDTETFGESLLGIVPKIKKICKHLDEQVYKTALISYMPFVTVTEQFDEIMDKIFIKSELMTLYKVTAKWYSGLTDKQKKFYRYYFVKRDERTSRKILKNSQFRVRYLSPMIRSYMDRVRKEFRFNELNLLRNPYIYKSYIKVSNMTDINGGKGGRKHDNTANERRNCQCV